MPLLVDSDSPFAFSPSKAGGLAKETVTGEH